MPWYGTAYVVAYFALCIFGDLFQWRAGMAAAKWWIESLTHLGVGWLLVGYWNERIVEHLGAFAPVFFVFALVWEAWSTWDGIKADSDSTSPDSEKDLMSAFLTVLLIGPAYILAGIAAFR